MARYSSLGRPLAVLVTVLASGLMASPARAGCGCAKPPPPLAAVRPFVGFGGQTITLFDSRLNVGANYQVQFVARADGSTDWSRGQAVLLPDLADGMIRPQLRVKVGEVSFGPCQINVWENGVLVYSLTDDQFTVTAQPVALHQYAETVTQDGYQAGVGSDGTVYIAVDVKQVSVATTFTGVANGFPLVFGAPNVAMYNTQGFFMQALDPTIAGLFRITAGTAQTSNMLAYWRHEFQTYKDQHRQLDAYNTDANPDWHADGSRHVDHDTIFVAIAGTLPNGTTPAPGATPPFQLQVTSAPSVVSPL